MLLLTSITDTIRLVTVSASDIDFYCAWVDLTAGAVTPARSSGNITTATTTTIVAAPAAATQRNVKMIRIDNQSATASSVITVEHFDGTVAVALGTITLLPGENFGMDEIGVFTHRDANGAPYTYSAPIGLNTGVNGTLAETMPRVTCPEVNTAGPASGTLAMAAIQLVAGTLVSTIDIWSATTAAGTPTNYNVGLYDINRNLLAQSTNKLTEAWAANSQKSFALTTPYLVPVSGIYYIGYYMTATTVATLKGGNARTGGQLNAAAPIIYGTSNTGLTVTLPNPANAITSSTASIYAAVR